jgi:cysteine desulfurase/selenocysteine lyase
MNQPKLDISGIRKQFPILDQQVNGHALIYLDNAATNQKPLAVINALEHYYSTDNANIHRGIHTLAERATAAFEATRSTIREFINAAEDAEIIFTKGTTEGINLVAHSFSKAFIKAGDEIIITGMEHHSNIVPWQIACETYGAVLKVIPVNEAGELVLEEYERLLSPNTKLVACVYASNALGTINPVKHIIDKAHAVGAKVLIDGAQATAHIDIDVQALDADFFAFSAHKIYGPTGVGALYGKRALLDAMPPYQAGGEMIREVSFGGTTYNDLPYKFEAGTPNIADVIAFKAALDFVTATGREAIAAHEDELLAYFVKGLGSIEGADRIKLIGTATEKVAVQSFIIEGVHHFDAGMMLDAKGIAVRTGHHCTQPLMKGFCIEGTVRASFSVYNTKEEVDVLLGAIERICKLR